MSSGPERWSFTNGICATGIVSSFVYPDLDRLAIDIESNMSDVLEQSAGAKARAAAKARNPAIHLN